VARSAYDERFAKRAAQLEEEFKREAEAVVNEYRQDLDAYRSALEKKETDTSGSPNSWTPYSSGRIKMAGTGERAYAYAKACGILGKSFLGAARDRFGFG
jgi:hypothetical protein